jgi:hypothetical protein
MTPPALNPLVKHIQKNVEKTRKNIFNAVFQDAAYNKLCFSNLQHLAVQEHRALNARNDQNVPLKRA